MQFKIFKAAAEKADIEYQEAYEKGVNLGPERWSEAVRHFSEAAGFYSEAGNPQKSNEAYALASLFSALVKGSKEAWQECSSAMDKISDTALNVGFEASSRSLAQQSSILASDIEITGTLNIQSRDVSKVNDIRALAQRYMDLIDSDLSLWRLLKTEIDPQKRAFYLLGLADLIEANAMVDVDPKKSLSFLSEAATNLGMAGTYSSGVITITQKELDRISKSRKCWFCGREVQGQDYHYVLLPATITGYIRGKYGSTATLSMEGNAVVACESCSSAIRNVADLVANTYYEKLRKEMEFKLLAIEREIHELRQAISTRRIREN
ncbi:MAG: hypothetical protein M1388_01260 [Thaumarchaeota archaeon]|nr:hypothetical protein [Nitrososphaerota archaeon]